MVDQSDEMGNDGKGFTDIEELVQPPKKDSEHAEAKHPDHLNHSEHKHASNSSNALHRKIIQHNAAKSSSHVHSRSSSQRHGAERHERLESREKSESSSGFMSANTLIIVLGVVLAILFVANIILLASTKMLLNSGEAAAQEQAKPIEVSMVLITNSGCTDCASLSTVVQSLKSNSRISVKGEKTLEYNVPEAKALMATYGITKIPAIVLMGNASAIISVSSGFVSNPDGTIAFQQVSKAPYTTPTGDVNGRMSATIIAAPECTVCLDFNTYLAQLKQNNYVIAQTTTITEQSPEGQAAIKTYNISRLPALLLSSDIDAYPDLAQLGVTAADNTRVVEIPAQMPHKDLASGKILGEVNLILLNDSSCSGCYDVNVHKQIIANPSFGLQSLKSERTVDISSAEGKALVAKYNITTVPTIIMQGDVAMYTSLVQVWKQVGSVEADGSYVFRDQSALQMPYKDLTTGKLVTPAPANATA